MNGGTSNRRSISTGRSDRRFPSVGPSDAVRAVAPRLVELERTRERLEHGLGDAGGVPALELRVIEPVAAAGLTGPPNRAIDMPGMGWSDITPGASYTEPALRRAIVEFVTALDLAAARRSGPSLWYLVSTGVMGR